MYDILDGHVEVLDGHVRVPSTCARETVTYANTRCWYKYKLDPIRKNPNPTPSSRRRTLSPPSPRLCFWYPETHASSSSSSASSSSPRAFWCSISSMDFESSYDIPRTVDYICSRGYSRVVLQVPLSSTLFVGLLIYNPRRVSHLLYFLIPLSTVSGWALEGFDKCGEGAEVRARQGRALVRHGRYGVQLLLRRWDWGLARGRGVRRALWARVYEPVSFYVRIGNFGCICSFGGLF